MDFLLKKTMSILLKLMYNIPIEIANIIVSFLSKEFFYYQVIEFLKYIYEDIGYREYIITKYGAKIGYLLNYIYIFEAYKYTILFKINILYDYLPCQKNIDEYKNSKIKELKYFPIDKKLFHISKKITNMLNDNTSNDLQIFIEEIKNAYVISNKVLILINKLINFIRNFNNNKKKINSFVTYIIEKRKLYGIVDELNNVKKKSHLFSHFVIDKNFIIQNI
jgi:hypothetical protein